MTLRFDPPRHCGAHCVAVVSEVSVSARGVAGGVFGHGRKTPAAFVVRDGQGLCAFDLRGRQLNVDRLEADCPGLIAAMQASAE